jgi:hypothetical protein
MRRKRLFLSLGHGACIPCRPDQPGTPELMPREDEGLAQTRIVAGFRAGEVIVDIGNGRYWLLPTQEPLSKS